jgi:hypothetical protein
MQPQFRTTDAQVNDLAQSRVVSIFRRDGIVRLNQLLRCCPGTYPLLLSLNCDAGAAEDDTNNYQSANVSG